MIYAARINVTSCNRTCRIEANRSCGKGSLARTIPRARGIERGDGAVAGAHVAMKYVARISVILNPIGMRAGRTMGQRVSIRYIVRTVFDSVVFSIVILNLIANLPFVCHKPAWPLARP